jgi:hypothetical protein
MNGFILFLSLVIACFVSFSSIVDAIYAHVQVMVCPQSTLILMLIKKCLVGNKCDHNEGFALLFPSGLSVVVVVVVVVAVCSV